MLRSVVHDIELTMVCAPGVRVLCVASHEHINTTLMQPNNWLNTAADAISNVRHHNTSEYPGAKGKVVAVGSNKQTIFCFEMELNHCFNF